MPQSIRKRDGSTVGFQPDKITLAVLKATEAAGDPNLKLAQKVTSDIVDFFEKCKPKDYIPAVEEVQDLVEIFLMKSGAHDAAKKYIVYREQHRKMREMKAGLPDYKALVGDYIDKNDWRVKENSNTSFSLQGLNNYISSAVSAQYWLQAIYPEEVRQAHKNGDMHIHDLGILAVYCCGWELRDLLLSGFGGASYKIKSKPPKHFRAILGQLVNFFYTLQGEAAGAQAVSNFDTYLAPFVRYDGLSYKEVKQCIQEFVFNCNVPTRVGFQTPFTNITMDVTPTKLVGEENAIIGGKVMPEKYKDFQAEMDMINEAFAEVMAEGDAEGRVFTFPIPTYCVTKDFPWDKPALKKVWEMTAKYGIPYFSNFVNSDMNPDDARSMCPLAGEEKILFRSSRGRSAEYSSIRNMYEGQKKNEEYEIYAHGKFVKATLKKFTHQKMLCVTLANGHEIKMSEEHLNYVLLNKQKGIEIVRGRDLQKGMYLPYSLLSYDGEGGVRDLGYFAGAFAGDGSFDGDTTVVFSLEEHFKKRVLEKLKIIGQQYFAAHSTVVHDKTTKLVTLKIHSASAVGLCRDFVANKQRNKHYKARTFLASKEFRQGVLEGHYDTDGGNRGRIYTSSWKMVETLNMLSATLGTTTSIYRDDRLNRLGKEPNYAVLVYKLNRKQYSDIWFKNGDKLWVKIQNIRALPYSAAYCFEVNRGEPIFTVGTTGILTHNCRLRLDNRELRKRGGGLFAANPLTGSIGVVTINMARLGYLAKSKKDLFARLDRLMKIARESLQVKRKVLEQFTARGLYPYSKFYLRNIHERFGEYWKNHFNTIGINGVNEMLLNFFGKDIASEEGKAFAVEVMVHMRDKLLEFQEEDNQLYNLEATPAEGVTYRFAKHDKEEFPEIVVANNEAWKKDGADPYYTNSSHLPVGFTDDVFSALDLQDDLQTLYTGGTVLHGFLGEKMPSPESTKSLVQKIAANYRLPYYTITPTFSICPNHGYLAGEHFFCPRCDEAIGYKEEAESSPHSATKILED